MTEFYIQQNLHTLRVLIKNKYISEHQLIATQNKMNLLLERFIEPNKEAINKRLVKDLLLLREQTKDFCEKKLNNIELGDLIKDIKDMRNRIKYQCRKIIGTHKNYY